MRQHNVGLEVGYHTLPPVNDPKFAARLGSTPHLPILLPYLLVPPLLIRLKINFDKAALAAAQPFDALFNSCSDE
jgi:hypothetical protein